ncbi:septation protein SepH [Gulosibacter sp. ACHW.36C]|uniref:Septation protein SepH n=1 Tax=Gulosibacter sediminis TaxID=1729695 RepID=A0ABY4MXW8_9MICO|nr:septation protein SepH [Gulosibacter sediminis]UQN13843.1 septation protein SepH [Gulosibacter sediminis]
MQELRFVSVEDGWILATNENGDRFRLRVDDTLQAALRPQRQVRSAGPKVPPREIQQLIRAGHTVDEVVAETGADRETVERFEAPIIAERGYIVEQARGVPVRLQQQVDPLSSEATNFGVAIDARLEQLEARQVRWDAWRDPETGWHVGLNFVTGDVERHALWKFDTKGHALRPDSPAAVTLSQQGEVQGMRGPHLRAVAHEHPEGVIPVAEKDAPAAPEASEATSSATTYETADLLEQLRRRRGERQHTVYDEMAEYQDDDELVIDRPADASEPQARVTPFAAASAQPDETQAKPEAEVDPEHDPVAPEEDANQLDLAVDEAEQAPSQSRKRTGARPAMPTWDEIVFGTRTDD